MRGALEEMSVKTMDRRQMKGKTVSQYQARRDAGIDNELLLPLLSVPTCTWNTGRTLAIAVFCTPGNCGEVAANNPSVPQTIFRRTVPWARNLRATLPTHQETSTASIKYSWLLGNRRILVVLFIFSCLFVWQENANILGVYNYVN